MPFSRKPKRWLWSLLLTTVLTIILAYRYFTSDSHSLAFVVAIVLSLVGVGYCFSIGIKLGFFKREA